MADSGQGGGLRDHGEAIEARWACWAVLCCMLCCAGTEPPLPEGFRLHAATLTDPPLPAPPPIPTQVLALPVASIQAFIGDESMGKSAGLLFSLMWMQERLEAHGGRLFASSGQA